MTTIITSNAFTVNPADIDALRDGTPDIDAVVIGDSTAQMLRVAQQATAPVVLVVDGAEPASGMGQLASRFAATEASGGLVAIGSTTSCEDIAHALLAGVKGWVQPASPVEELITAIRAVASGHLFLPPELLQEMADTVLLLAAQRSSRESGCELTNRELEVLRLLAVGDPNSQIAADLFISEATVHSHVLNILRKLRARNRTEAVAMVYRQGLITAPAPAAAS